MDRDRRHVLPVGGHLCRGLSFLFLVDAVLLFGHDLRIVDASVAFRLVYILGQMMLLVLESVDFLGAHLQQGWPSSRQTFVVIRCFRWRLGRGIVVLNLGRLHMTQGHGFRRVVKLAVGLCLRSLEPFEVVFLR